MACTIEIEHIPHQYVDSEGLIVDKVIIKKKDGGSTPLQTPDNQLILLLFVLFYMIRKMEQNL